MRIKDLELCKVSGGSDVVSTFFKYLSDTIEKVFAVGQGFGEAIRRIATGNICPL